MSKDKARRERAALRPGARPARKRFLQATAVVGAGLAVGGPVARAGLAAAAPTARPAVELPAAAACNESVQDLVDTALVAERLAVTFYHAGLSERAILRDKRIAGSSANPNAVARDGDPGNVAYLQAALDQEDKHAHLLQGLGARTAHARFYFPAATFEELGYTTHPGTFLWVLDHLETAFIGAYLAAAARFDVLGRGDLALLAMRILGVESEHRALYRVIAGDEPANNVTVEVSSFACVGDVATALRPFLTGEGLPGGGVARALPTQAQIARAVGRNKSGY